MTLSGIFYKAAEAIKERGWARFTRHADYWAAQTQGCRVGAVCALGAIEAAVGAPLSDDTHPAFISLIAHLPHTTYHGLVSFPKQTSIAAWNNAPERTAEEVIATLLAEANCEAHKEQACSSS